MQQSRAPLPPAAVTVEGTAMHTLRQIDEWLGWPKGTAFRAFKGLRAVDGLVEGRDFLRFDAAGHGGWIEQLRARGQVYGATVHAVVFTTGAAQRLRRQGMNIPDRG